jgi:hypothetical protein
MKPLPLALALLLLVATVTTTHAAPASQQCVPNAVTQRDLAGFYESSTMRLSIYPCGGSYLEWTNDYGTHAAAYVTVQHLSDGVVAEREYVTPFYLDTSEYIAYKAAEPGYVQIITNGPGGLRTYKLRKMY